AKELNDIVPVERYIEIADEVKKNKPIYYIWGGEPFLYPGLFDLTKKIKDNDSILALVTNATFLTQKAEDIVKQKWDALMFSLDGPEEIHDKIRGKKGTFQKVKEGIQAVKALKTKNKTKLPWIMALVTVSIDNAGSLDTIFETGKELGVDCIIVYYSWFTEEKIGQRHTKLWEKKLGVTPVAWKGYLFDHDIDTKALATSIQKIRAKKWDFPYLFIPELKEEELDTYYKDPTNFFGYGPCISPWMVTEITANVDVAPCRDYPDYIVGNIRETSLKEIWNGEKYKKFRKVLKECGGTFPICSRCCGLMGW
ncbi:MAG: radical SAM protein, partial [Candidatus Pacearchaeota archaeon]|nr:radical SAM protein [Candidatus Pacearchaeota archaeon]